MQRGVWHALIMPRYWLFAHFYTKSIHTPEPIRPDLSQKLSFLRENYCNPAKLCLSSMTYAYP